MENNQFDVDRNEQQKLLDQLRQERLISLKLARWLTREAYERMSNIKYSNPELYHRVAAYLIQAGEMGKLSGRIDDPTLVKILNKFLSVKKRTDYRIIRK